MICKPELAYCIASGPGLQAGLGAAELQILSSLFGAAPRRLAEKTSGLSEGLKDIAGLVFAGGSVAGAICDCPIGDVDIFLHCPIQAARGIIERVYAAVAAHHAQKYGRKGKLLVTRSKNAVTLFQVAPDSCGPPPIQVILSVYADIKELLQGFDVDSCCFCYSPKEQKVWANQRGVRALVFGANLADSRHDGPGYVRRLEKYDSRGFAIAVPGFDPLRLSREVLGYHIYLQKHDVLLRPRSAVDNDEWERHLKGSFWILRCQDNDGEREQKHR